MSSVSLAELRAYLDDFLRIDAVPDFPGSVNGLQIEGPDRVTKIAAAVDACEYSIEAAVESGAELLLVHHGLYWGTPVPLTGAKFRRVARLVRGGCAVYSAHLPLDVHPVVGNNHRLASLLGVDVDGGFAAYQGVDVAIEGTWRGDFGDLVSKVREQLGVEPQVFGFGSSSIARVGILTGSGGSTVAEAAARGLDAFVTGEGTHPSYFDAEENGLNLVLAGHYATETLGVRALSEHLASRFGIETLFVDHPTGL